MRIKSEELTDLLRWIVSTKSKKVEINYRVEYELLEFHFFEVRLRNPFV